MICATKPTIDRGHQSNWLRVIEFSHRDKKSNDHYRCLCQCGKEVIVRGSNLKNGHSKSCGCFKLQALAERHIANRPPYRKYEGNHWYKLSAESQRQLIRASAAKGRHKNKGSWRRRNQRLKAELKKMKQAAKKRLYRTDLPWLKAGST
jgi:hypothetical protein